MLLLKLILQVGIGISGFFTVLIDYKYHDKRTVKFRRLRLFLIYFSVVLIVGNIVLTIYDENNKKEESKDLQSNLYNVQNRLDSTRIILNTIKENGDNINAKLEPFLEIAKSKFPGLSSSAALDSLVLEIKQLSSKTSNLEKLEFERHQKEADLELLKKTKPLLEGVLSMDKNKNMYVGIKILNNVPVNLRYSLIHSYDGQIKNTSGNNIMDLYPTLDKQLVYYKDFMNFPELIPKTKYSFIKLDVYYESVFLKEDRTLNLRSFLSKNYRIDPFNNILTEIKE